MNRISLRERLRSEGVADGRYELTGIHEATRPDLAFYFLEERSGEWLVGVQERGKREVMARFAAEDEACRYLYDRLTWREPPPVAQTPEQEERGRRITEDLVRRLKDRSRPRTDE
jgi:hypothetical protein